MNKDHGYRNRIDKDAGKERGGSAAKAMAPVLAIALALMLSLTGSAFAAGIVLRRRRPSSR